MTALFNPKRPDGMAEWRVVYDMTRDGEYGALYTHPVLCEALERDPEDLRPVYRAVSRAAKELRRHDQRSLESVPGVGYKLLRPGEHALQARRFYQSGRRKVNTSLEVVRGTNLELLTEIERQQSISLSMVLNGMCTAIATLDQRQRKMDRLLAGFRTETDDRLTNHEEQIVRMKEAMREAGLLDYA